MRANEVGYYVTAAALLGSIKTRLQGNARKRTSGAGTLKFNSKRGGSGGGGSFFERRGLCSQLPLFVFREKHQHQLFVDCTNVEVAERALDESLDRRIGYNMHVF